MPFLFRISGVWTSNHLYKFEEEQKMNLTEKMESTYVMGSKLDAHMQACIDACNACMQACNECFDICCEAPMTEEKANCLKLLRDCADACALLCQMVARNSSSAKLVASICANICETCARACENCSDACCKMCAEMCRRCADACREACC